MKMLNFPELKQAHNWDCGATCLQAVFLYYGLDIAEEKIIEIAETNDDRGTLPSKMLEAIKHFGLKAESKNLSLKKIKQYIDKEIPVILLLQAWADEANVDWLKHFESGHYVVAIGYGEGNIYFEDPWSFARTFLPEQILLDRWHDVDFGGHKYINWGVAVTSSRGRKYPLPPKKMT